MVVICDGELKAQRNLIGHFLVLTSSFSYTQTYTHTHTNTLTLLTVFIHEKIASMLH